MYTNEYKSVTKWELQQTLDGKRRTFITNRYPSFRNIRKLGIDNVYIMDIARKECGCCNGGAGHKPYLIVWYSTIKEKCKSCGNTSIVGIRVPFPSSDTFRYNLLGVPSVVLTCCILKLN